MSRDGNALKVVSGTRFYRIGTNTTGFSALMAGYCYYDGSFLNLRSATAFWSSTESDAESAWDATLLYESKDFFFLKWYKNMGFSVRCIKD
ncbi:MAG: hypothetical protein A2315_03700 [Ignavibacteria bacterium RIFOXYB2_FULL_35_12]|nr:MAG: hypothetical protein A2058_08750 [Ignavibacteria bacterium GWA2_36_19]OGU53506.1 MAG: hypothetical protein A2006_10675 [Ignavibacteria bacterium GWC2_35_8]OGU63007.1 MAG: hypothetical protein A2X60_00870 [Ignavibacteria bacterium GWF2_35_20]OGU82884.1 MAG: hypothetical protein A2254_02145 [Ignavibacteria bacterium RIFOXYA2_FULL_35_9]OGU86544.1 MAG: hypothetical protein A2492_01545 [Ignavibacteria bacterium RIFOXYC12_FULL_35_11]OGU89005.1 MAG: hypothetical protein A3K31_01280 [Ignavibac